LPTTVITLLWLPRVYRIGNWCLPGTIH